MKRLQLLLPGARLPRTPGQIDAEAARACPAAATMLSPAIQAAASLQDCSEGCSDPAPPRQMPSTSSMLPLKIKPARYGSTSRVITKTAPAKISNAGARNRLCFAVKGRLLMLRALP